MWIYILRRLLLMIPTLFGVTVVSFVVMYLSPGDPILERFKSSGTAGASTQTREAYVVMKRDMKLDRPLLLNFRHFTDYRQPLRMAAHYRGLPFDQLVAEIEAMSRSPLSPELAERKAFLKALSIDKGDRIDKFEERLHPPLNPDLDDVAQASFEQETHRSLAQAVEGYVMIWCENLGAHGVAPCVEMLQAPTTSLQLKIGAIKALQTMVISPFDYTFPSQPTPEDVVRVQATWRILWEREKSKYEPLEEDRLATVRKSVAELAADTSEGARARVFAYIVNADFAAEKFAPEDAPAFADMLLGDAPLSHQVVAAEALRQYISASVETDVPLDASDEQVARVAANWKAFYTAHESEFQHGTATKLWAIVGDTQYAHMAWRLVTFNFGRSALKTREPVSEKLWNAAAVSAPIMLFAELLIFGLAIPVGVICAVNRNNVLDRGLQFMLFLLYSVPPFVAGMLSLLYLAYGRYWKIFPMERLHSAGYETFDWPRYLLDYSWHAVLPVACLSLFSWPSIAQYARSSMLDVLGQDYVRTARAKGVHPFWVYAKHAFRNSLITVITLFASFLPALLGGSVLVEYIFNINGMGRLSLSSIENKDYPTLMALIYVDAIVVMLSVLLADIMYVFADPRISFESQDKGT